MCISSLRHSGMSRQAKVSPHFRRADNEELWSKLSSVDQSTIGTAVEEIAKVMSDRRGWKSRVDLQDIWGIERWNNYSNPVKAKMFKVSL